MTRIGLVLTAALMMMACGADPPSAEKCEYDGKTYGLGETFPDKDGCNTCTCILGSEVACTEKACAPTCKYEGKTYNPGDSFPASDGCNTCFCSDDGNVGCTKKACPAACEYEGSSYPVGASFPAKDGCNTCQCFAAGMVACTEKGCPANVWLSARPLKCNGNPWQKQANKGDGDTPAYSVKELIEIDNYFEDQKIDLLELGLAQPVNPLIGCESCDCPRGDILLVRSTSVDAPDLKSKYGFKELTDKSVLSYSPRSCHMNPWIKNGQPSSDEGKDVAAWSEGQGAPLSFVGFVYKTKDPPTCLACSCPRGDRLVVYPKTDAGVTKLTSLKFTSIIAP